MQKGLVFDIQRFSVHDGPGIRTTVFLKGCPLRCRWCHNPEGLKNKKQLQFIKELCIGCKKCETVCKNNVHTFVENVHHVDFSKCTQCFDCVSVCPSKALLTFGKEYTAPDLLKEIQKDCAFYGAEGGVTFSGGEALLQVDFIAEIAQLCKENGISTALDTCGALPTAYYEKVLPYIDIFLYDIKLATSEKHKQATGMDNALILQNFVWLNAHHARLWVRVPIINGYNQDEEEIEKIIQIIKGKQCVEQVTLIPYHKLGSNKYEQLGEKAQCDQSQIVKKEDMARIISQFRNHNLPLDE